MTKLSDFGYNVKDDNEDNRHRAIEKMVNAGLGKGLYKTFLVKHGEFKKAHDNKKPSFNAWTPYQKLSIRFMKDAEYTKSIIN